jgi:hypothetical protein
MHPRLSGLKVFWPGVETCLRLGLVGILFVVVFLPLAWGYRQHTQAEAWHDLACRYRLKEALRDRLVTSADLSGPPCVRLAELGLELEPPTLLPRPRASAPDPGVWPAASVSE